MVQDLFPGAEGSHPGPAARLGSIVLFRARAPGYGLELWRRAIEPSSIGAFRTNILQADLDDLHERLARTR
jgi:hypothetical protein